MKRFLRIFLCLILVGWFLPLTAHADDMYVTDSAGILNEEDARALNRRAGALENEYGIGVYVVILPASSNVELDAERFISGKDGIILVLSMDSRDYALSVNGSKAHEAFSDYAQNGIINSFLDDFADDEWNNGLSDYLDACATCLSAYAQGTPVKKPFYEILLSSLGISAAIAALVTFILARRDKTVFKAQTATAYTFGHLHLQGQRDQYINTTTVARTIQRSMPTSSQGTSTKSGKF